MKYRSKPWLHISSAKLKVKKVWAFKELEKLCTCIFAFHDTIKSLSTTNIPFSPSSRTKETENWFRKEYCCRTTFNRVYSISLCLRLFFFLNLQNWMLKHNEHWTFAWLNERLKIWSLNFAFPQQLSNINIPVLKLNIIFLWQFYICWKQQEFY